MSAVRPEPAVQVAHPERAREGGADRPLVQVAVGVLIRGEAFLLTSRPEGKVYAGYWEGMCSCLDQCLQQPLQVLAYVGHTACCRGFDTATMRQAFVEAYEALPIGYCH